MSFSVQPKGSAAVATPPGVSARDRAIARLLEQPVPNATKVAPEETAAVMPPAEAPKLADALPNLSSDPVKGQNDNSVDPAKAEAAKPKEETEGEKKAEDPLSSQYAVLARKEKQLRAKAVQQETALKAREDALKQKEAEIASKQTEYQSKFVSKEELLKDPIGVLRAAGLSYDQVTAAAMGQTTPEDPAAQYQRMREEITAQIMAELKPIKEGQEKVVQSIQEQQQSAYKEALAQIRSEVVELVETSPEEFEAIKAADAADDVVELIERTYKEEKRLMTPTEAAKEIEEYLAEEAFKFAGASKVRKRFEAPAKSEAPKSEEPTKQTQQMKTLTNANSASKPMSPRERAIAAFNRKLNAS